MKKLISLFLAFAMLFSLAMPAMAAEGDTATVYFQNNWIWTDVCAYIHYTDGTENAAAPGVAMTFYENDGIYDIYSVTFPVSNIDYIVFSGIKDDGSGARDATAQIPSSDLYRNATYYCQWNDGNTYGREGGEGESLDSAAAPSGPSVNGGTGKDVTASYTPTITITGFRVEGDTITYDEATRTYTITFPEDAESIRSKMMIVGTNLNYIPADDTTTYLVRLSMEGIGGGNLPIAAGSEYTYDEISGALVAETEFSADVFAEIAGHSMTYAFSTDGGKTWTEEYTLAFVQGPTEPTVEALWGTSENDLTESGTLDEAIAAATAVDSTIGYIQLQNNVTLDYGYDIYSGSFTLDLNGNTLTSPESFALAARDSAVEMTLTDTATGGTVITESSVSSAVIATGGKLVIHGGSYFGSDAVFLANGGVAEINGGTFTGAATNGYAVSVDVMSTLNIADGIFSGSWAAVCTSGTTTITGGTFTGGSDGQISYLAGTLDLSDYTGDDLTLSQWTGSDLTVSDETIKLPEGYVFKDGSGNTVDTLVYGTIYTIAAETSVPTYTVTIADGINGGTVTVDKPTAKRGETVTVTVEAEAGYAYVVNSLSVTNKTTGEEVVVDEASKTFEMPAFDVTVTATFEKLSVTSAEITWGSMSFTYDDTIPEGETEENGWSNDGSAGAGTVTVTNTGTTAFTASAAYEPAGDFGITGSLDEAKTLAANDSGTFTLTLSGKPNKALNSEKIGTVTITIEEAAPVAPMMNVSALYYENPYEGTQTISRTQLKFYDDAGAEVFVTEEYSGGTATVTVPAGAATFKVLCWLGGTSFPQESELTDVPTVDSTVKFVYGWADEETKLNNITVTPIS